MRRRRLTPEFKRSIIEQLLSETAGQAELCRRYNVSSGLLLTWKKQYAQGKLDPDPGREVELQARMRDLEQMSGNLTLENEFKKKPCATASSNPRQKTVHCRKPQPPMQR